MCHALPANVGISQMRRCRLQLGADALSNAHDFTVTMMLYVVYLVYAIAAIVGIIGALQIYIKMNTGEGDVTKSIMMLIGACLFMIGATILFPTFFGYNIV